MNMTRMTRGRTGTQLNTVMAFHFVTFGSGDITNKNFRQMNQRYSRPKMLLLAATAGLFFFAIFMPGFFSSLIPALASKAAGDNDKPVWLTETISVDTPAALTLETSGGFIDIDSHQHDEIVVDFIVRKNREYLRDTDEAPVEITINQDESVVEVFSKVTSDSRWFRRSPSVSVSYQVLVPSDTRIRAKTSGGPVSGRNLSADVSFVTSGGGIDAQNISGTLLARTSGGPISLEGITGDMTARTSGGGITVSDATGNLKARTSGGPITLRSVSGTIEAVTSGGPIDAGIPEIGEFLTLETSGGPISVKLPDHQGLDIRARGSSIQNNLDNLDGLMEQRSLSGTVKGGGVPVDIKTTGGGVRLDYY